MRYSDISAVQLAFLPFGVIRLTHGDVFTAVVLGRILLVGCEILTLTDMSGGYSIEV